jgi:hypothetical protein
MRRFAVLLVFASAVACGGDSSTKPSASVSGSYALRTVNDMPLPWIAVENSGNKWEVVNDVMILSDSGTYTESGINRFTVNGEIRIENFNFSGTYTVTGTGITFVDSDNIAESGFVSAGTLTIRAQGVATPVVAVYQRD